MPTPHATPDLDIWGKDHWSTFAYVETRIVDYSGQLGFQHMRGHLESRPERYPTMMKRVDGELVTLAGHDDFDCVLDAIALGLLTSNDEEINAAPWEKRDPHRRLVRLVHEGGIVFEFTPLGAEVAAALRTHKAEGKNFASFEAPKSAAFRARVGAASNPVLA